MTSEYETTALMDNHTLQFRPPNLRFGDDNRLSVAIYSCLFCVAAPGNLLVFCVLWRSRIPKSNKTARRVRLFIGNLCCADLIVSLIMVPSEIAWHATVSWRAGDVMCRVMMLFRTLGFYSGSLVLIAMSVDRCYAIRFPLKMSSYSGAVRWIICIWVVSIIFSTPQVSQAVH